MSKPTSMPLRSRNPYTYHGTAEASPISSKRGGCHKWDMVRTSAVQRSSSLRESCSALAPAPPSRPRFLKRHLARHFDGCQILSAAVVQLAGDSALLGIPDAHDMNAKTL